MVKKEQENQENNQAQATQNADETTQNTPKTDNSASGTQTNGEDINSTVEEQVENAEADIVAQIIDEKEIMIKSLQEKNDELNDKYLRLFSEFDNFRKRTMKEKLELTKTASADIITAILPIVDDLERAYKSAVENSDNDALIEGLNLIQSKMKTTLKHKGLEEMPCVGENFNTDYHEAITHTPAKEEKDKGKVIEEIQKGYMLNGKILRFAKVVVAN